MSLSRTIFAALQVSAILQSFVAGIQLVMFIYILTRFLSFSSHSRRMKRLYMLVSFVVLILSCIGAAMEAITAFNTILKASLDTYNTLPDRLLELNHTLSYANISQRWIGDALLVYRCYILWDHRIYIAVLPLIFFLLSLGTSIANLILDGRDFPKALLPADLSFHVWMHVIATVIIVKHLHPGATAAFGSQPYSLLYLLSGHHVFGMALPTRKIGQDLVPEVGLGLMGLSAFYGKVDDDEDRLKVLDAALEVGCTFWDSADIYGDSEELLGKWFKRTGNRKRIFLATKFGVNHQAPGTINGKSEYVKQAIERSLTRLGVDQIDLYYLHRADKDTPIEVTVGAMAELVREGKVRYLGLSEVSSETLRRAHAVHPIAAVQVEYSPFCLDIETERVGLLKTCRELGVAVVAYSPVGRGLLTGRFKSIDDFEPEDFRRMVPMFQKNFDKILTLADNIKNIAKKHNATAAQVCLAWLLAQGDDIFVIPGTRKIEYLKENVAASKVKLTADELAEIRDFANKAGLTGEHERYPEAMMKALFVDTPPFESK
ncbi:arylalcohol dehydrogenase [Coprinopsis cinerea AmutBmut pab1-1]|nr:arylalcohol dehydrogenase [Coprinopsis cinerea AmutBmut pab1-1]